MSLLEILAKNAKEYRKALGLTQSELSDKSGIDQSVISKVENGTLSIGLSLLETYAKALEKQPHELLVDADKHVGQGDKLFEIYHSLNKNDQKLLIAISEAIKNQKSTRA